MAGWGWRRRLRHNGSALLENREYGLTADDVIPQFDADLRCHWQVNVGTRAELDQADAVPAFDFLPLLHKRNDAPRDHAGDQPNTNPLPGGLSAFKAEQHVFIIDSGFGFERIEELPHRIFKQRDFAADWRVL